MTPKRLFQTAVLPALAELGLQGIKDSPEARRLLVAIAMQESGLRHRRQVSSDGQEIGPAVSWWQFERAGGCRGVLTHRVASPLMLRICDLYDIDASELGLWEAMRYQDVVAAAAARLLIYTLPSPLPANPEDGWTQYIQAWRPGKPRPETWGANWAIADSVVQGI